MTEKEIIELARKTRQAQTEYRATRSRMALNASRALERQLDLAIEEYTAANPRLLVEIFNEDGSSQTVTAWIE